MKVFDIRNVIVSLFRNGFIRSLDYESTVGLGPNLKSEKSIAKRTKMRRQRFDEVVRDEKNTNSDLFKEHFKYQSPSIMYKAFNETGGTERNKIQIYLIKNGLTVLKKDITNTSKKDGHKIEKKKDVAEKILYSNDDENQDQEGQGLKILTPTKNTKSNP